MSIFIKELEEVIVSVYETGVTLEEAEKLAGRFLHAQLQVSTLLKEADLNARMRKSGLKAVKAAAYTNIVGKSDKKPTEAAIDAMITSDEIVDSEQQGFDKAEVERDELERVYNVCREAHVYLRGIAKGRFE